LDIHQCGTHPCHSHGVFRDRFRRSFPILRAPDDPGVDDEAPGAEFAEQIGTPKAQAGGWRGFLARWGA